MKKVLIILAAILFVACNEKLQRKEVKGKYEIDLESIVDDIDEDKLPMNKSIIKLLLKTTPSVTANFKESNELEFSGELYKLILTNGIDKNINYKIENDSVLFVKLIDTEGNKNKEFYKFGIIRFQEDFNGFNLLLENNKILGQTSLRFKKK